MTHNSPLQFRCWDKKAKAFFYWGYNIKAKNTFIGPLDPAALSQQLATIFNNHNVYVGDIIEGKIGKYKIIGEVIMDCGAFSLKPYWLDDFCGYDMSSRPFLCDIQISEVLGHVFEREAIKKYME